MLHPKVFDSKNSECIASGFHREILGGLLLANGDGKSYPEYKSRSYCVDLLSQDEFAPDLMSKHRKAEKTVALECLTMLRTGKDLTVEYGNGDELKRLRHAYITHVTDYVCHDRQRVFHNDMILLKEKNKDRVTLDNVFDIANKQDKKQTKNDDSSDEDQ